MKIYLKEDCCLEIDEAIFTEPNLSRHAEGADGRNSHILADGEEFNWRDPKFDSSMSKEDYAKEAEALSNAKAGKHEDNSNPEKLEDKIFGWVFHNPKYNTDRKFKVKIPSGPTQFNPHALPELVIYSMDDSTVITYMLLKGPRSLYNYEDQFVKELDEQMIELSEAVDVDYDYQTGDADMKTADVFDINKSDSSYSTGLLPGNKENDYYREHKNKVGEIVYMTANEYYDACAEGFRKLGNDSSVEKLKKGREHDDQDIKDLQKIVVEKGKKLPIPYLDYTKTFAQEGLHRIMAMAELFDWDKTKFPILVIKYADESKHIEDLKWQDQHKIEQDVIQPSQDFHYHDKEELLDQLKWELERHEYGWEYIEHPENLEIRVDNDADKGITKLTFRDPDSDFEFITDEYAFDFNADNRTDTQIGDLPEDELDAALIADLLLDESDDTKVKKLKNNTKKNVGDQEVANDIFNNSADTSAAPVSESIEKHETLNPKLWGKDEELLPEVRDGIQKIVNQFVTELKENEVELKVLDVILVGSNASYNYTKDSDLDVHIVADTSIIPCEYGLLPIIYNMARSQFNNKYDVTIHDVPVEIYVEGMNTSANSNGIYSLNNGWIKKPVAMDIPEIDISDLYPEWEERAKKILDDKDAKVEDVDKFIDDIYMLRKTSIMSDGEYGKGNMVFKEIRNNGYLDKLKELKVKLTEKDMIVEDVKTVYHSTNFDFDEFDKQYIGSENGVSFASGFFFADEPIDEYGHPLICRISYNNPLELDLKDDNSVYAYGAILGIDKKEMKDYIDGWGDVKGGLNKALRDHYGDDLEEVTNVLKLNGYDCLIVKNTTIGIKNKRTLDTEYIVFEPSQIDIVK